MLSRSRALDRPTEIVLGDVATEARASRARDLRPDLRRVHDATAQSPGRVAADRAVEPVADRDDEHSSRRPGARPVHPRDDVGVGAARGRCRGAPALLPEPKHQPRASDPVRAHLRADDREQAAPHTHRAPRGGGWEQQPGLPRRAEAISKAGVRRPDTGRAVRHGPRRRGWLLLTQDAVVRDRDLGPASARWLAATLQAWTCPRARKGLSGAGPEAGLFGAESEALAAVVGAVGANTIDLLGTPLAAPLAVEWAAARPEAEAGFQALLAPVHGACHRVKVHGPGLG